MHAVIIEDKMQEPLPTGLETSTAEQRLFGLRSMNINHKNNFNQDLNPFK
jgi:hypothetical protein